MQRKRIKLTCKTAVRAAKLEEGAKAQSAATSSAGASAGEENRIIVVLSLVFFISGGFCCYRLACSMSGLCAGQEKVIPVMRDNGRGKGRNRRAREE